MVATSKMMMPKMASAAMEEFFFRKIPLNIMITPNTADIMIAFIASLILLLRFNVHFRQHRLHCPSGQVEQRFRIYPDQYDHRHNKAQYYFFIHPDVYGFFRKCIGMSVKNPLHHPQHIDCCEENGGGRRNNKYHIVGC